MNFLILPLFDHFVGQTQPSEVNKHMISRSGDGSCSAGTANDISNEGNRSREPGAEENALNSKSRITHDKGHQILARSEADTMNYAQRCCFCFCLRRQKQRNYKSMTETGE